MRALLRVVLKAALGAAGGAVVMIGAGQLVGLFTDTCYVVCRPDVAAQLGALSGAVAVFTIQPYKPG